MEAEQNFIPVVITETTTAAVMDFSGKKPKLDLPMYLNTFKAYKFLFFTSTKR